MTYSEVDACVEAVIERVGKDIVLGTPLGLGKPNHLINGFYRKAKSDPEIKLKIFTAFTLQKPDGKSLLEKRFLGPLSERVFGDYPDLDYELDRVAGELPPNVDVIEFYFPAGKFATNSYAQRNYISSNYTHIFREMADYKVNVLAQMICEDEIHGKSYYSLSCNPDVSVDIIPWAKEEHKAGRPTAVVGQINNNLPFMFGDAVVERDAFDFVVDNPSQEYKLFGPPKMAVLDKDYMIGLYASTLVKDDGELQIGIGSLGDALAYSLKFRQEDNDAYNTLVKKFRIREKFGAVIEKMGDTGRFEKGLLGATEMLVDGFMHLWEAGILKRRVYDHLGLQRLLNEGIITEKVNPDMISLNGKAHHK